MIKKTLREYYVLSALNHATNGTIASIYSTFLIQRGMNLFEVNLVNFIFFVTLFISEIPTGAFADVFGRKYSFLVSKLLMCLGATVYAFSNTFWGFVTAEFICAIGATFASGAFRAWFIDKLKHNGYQENLSVIFSRSTQIGQLTGIVFALIGSYLANFSVTLPWLLMAMLYLISAGIAMNFSEEYFVHKKFSFKEGWLSMKNTVISSVNYGIKNKNVRFIILIVMVQVFLFQALNMQWQPFFGENFSNKSNFGFIWLGISTSIIFGSMLSSKFLKFFKNEKMALSICQLITGCFIVLTSVITLWPVSLLMFFMHEFSRGSFGPIKDAFLHDQIPSKERATIESFDSMFHHLGGALGLLFSGFLALKFGIASTWFVCGFLLIVFTLLVLFISRVRK